MSRRQLVVLGTASQVPTRTRSHNGYVLFFDQDAILFDPGEGAQRQLILAGISVSDLTRIAITHLHGDHALGLPGIAQRVSLDDVARDIAVSFPVSGAEYIEKLCTATIFSQRRELLRQPIHRAGPIPRLDSERVSTTALSAIPLDHGIETYGYRLQESDSVTFDPVKLAQCGITGTQVGQLQRDGYVQISGTAVTLDQVSTPRRGQSFGFCMDTRLCDGVYEIAQGADVCVMEATFLHRDHQLARDYGHLTARQAARVAAEMGVRHLVLTHFSQRYSDPEEFDSEARSVFDGKLTIATDLDRIDFPRRRRDPA